MCTNLLTGVVEESDTAGMPTVTARPITVEDFANFTIGQHVYKNTTPDWVARWTITELGGTTRATPMTSDTGKTGGLTPWAPWTFDRWLIEDPDGTPRKVHTIASHVVHLAVVVPIEEAGTAEEAMAVAEQRCGSHAEAWTARPCLDQTFHVFDRDGWLIAESVPASDLDQFSGKYETAGTVTFPGELPVRDCHRELMGNIETSKRTRPGPAPDKEMRATVIEGHARELSYGQLAAKTGVSRQRIAQIVKSLRRDTADADFTGPITPDLTELARFASVDTNTTAEARAAAQDLLDRSAVPAAT